MCNAWKGPLCNLQTMLALISLCICTGWSGPALSDYRINGHFSICQWTEKVQIKLHGCAFSPGPSLFKCGIRAFFPHCASIIVPILKLWYHKLPKAENIQPLKIFPDQSPRKNVAGDPGESNQWLPDHQSDMHLIEPPRLALSNWIMSLSTYQVLSELSLCDVNGK